MQIKCWGCSHSGSKHKQVDSSNEENFSGITEIFGTKIENLDNFGAKTNESLLLIDLFSFS